CPTAQDRLPLLRVKREHSDAGVIERRHVARTNREENRLAAWQDVGPAMAFLPLIPAWDRQRFQRAPGCGHTTQTNKKIRRQNNRAVRHPDAASHVGDWYDRLRRAATERHSLQLAEGGERD